MGEKDQSKGFLGIIRTPFSGMDSDGVGKVELTPEFLQSQQRNFDLVLRASGGAGSEVAGSLITLAGKERDTIAPDALPDVLNRYADLAREAEQAGHDEAATYFRGLREAHIGLAGEAGDSETVMRNLGRGDEGTISGGILRAIGRRFGRRG